MRLPGVNAELAAAIRRVNATYVTIPDRARPDLTGYWRDLDRDLDRTCATGDHDSAIAAIERWERTVLDLLGRRDRDPLPIGAKR